ATAITAGALALYMLLLPFYGWLSDQVGRKIMLVAGFGLGAALTFPIFSAIAETDQAWTAFWLMTVLLMVLSGYSSVSAVVKAELFPAHVRALGVALPYALANALFGGTAEYVALWFKQAGAESGFYIYVSAVMVVSLVVVMLLRDSRRHSLILED